MDTVFALISFLMMLLMIFGVFIYYAGMVYFEEVPRVLLVGVLSLLVGSLCWIVFAYNLAYNMSFASEGELIDLMITLLFYLYALTMLVGSVVERIRLSLVIGFIPLWTLIVYVPIANFVWGINASVLDFSGGLVVHLSAGVGALVLAKGLKPKQVRPEQTHHSLSLYTGTLLIMVGWFAFNMAPAKSLNDQAIVAWFNTFVSVVVGGLSGMLAQGKIDKEYTLEGALNGIITALVASTCSVGYVSPLVAGVIACLVASLCPFLIQRIAFHSDTVDSFVMNGLGGLMGSILFALFALQGKQQIQQILGSGLIALWSYCGAWLALWLVMNGKGVLKWKKSIR